MDEDDMDYMKGDSITNLSVLVQQLTAGNHNRDENICNNENFAVEYLFRPVAETTLREFIDTCVVNVSNFPKGWRLCSRDGSFNCDPVTKYVTACEAWRRAQKCGMGQDYPSEPCTMGMMMSQSTGLLILFSLVLIGVLIGISITVAACLICPNIHRWANKKIRGDHFTENGKTKSSSIFHLEAMDSQGSSGGQFEAQLRHQHSQGRGSDMQNGERESDEYAYIGMGEARLSGRQSLTDYEGLTRNNSQQQSHKYAYLPQTVPEDRHPNINEDSEEQLQDQEHKNNIGDSQENAQSNEEPKGYAHNYFVLEKNPNQ